MAKSRNRKNQKKKSTSRNLKIKEMRNRMKKYQEKMIEEFIKREQERGAFDDSNLGQDPADIIVDGPELG